MTHPQTQDDEALVEVMARAMIESNIRRKCPSWSDDDVAYHMSRITCGTYIGQARAALTALRNHEGRKGG